MQTDDDALTPSSSAWSVRQNHERRGVRSVAEAKASVRRSGWELTGPPGRILPWKFPRLPRIDSIDRLLVSSAPPVFGIDMEHVVSLTGFSFAADGWDPRVATLEQYRDDP